MLDRICILGSTGSIGCSTLDVISKNSDRYSVTVLTANTDYEKLFQQCLDYRPQLAVMACKESANELRQRVDSSGLDIEIRGGVEAINRVAEYQNIDTVVAAIVGAAGLLPTITAVRQSRKILLANKEALVMSGSLFMKEVKQYGVTLLPVDSEHNAIFQALPGAGENAFPNLSGIEKLLLTGSGGPFLKEPIEALESKSPAQACAHPNWDMGKKISVDSATMMNKGLELIEACYLFAVNTSQIQIVVHPQSIIHSMVSYVDGSVIAQMGNPDMKTPIAHCLAWPERINAGVKPLDFFQISALEFQRPDFKRFPCLALAYKAIGIGKSAPCIMNAANEIAVDAFLTEKIRFTQIAQVIDMSLSRSNFTDNADITQVIDCDKQARILAQAIIEELI